MLIISLITALFWAFLISSSLPNLKRGKVMIWFAILFLLNSAIGWAFFIGFSLIIQYKAVMVLFGFLVLISGFKWLEIIPKDFFSFGKHFSFLDLGPIIQSYAFYFCYLITLSQINVSGNRANGVFWILVVNIFLAGILLVVTKLKMDIKKHQWLEKLIMLESGIYLVVMGLIIMGGNASFFIRELRKFYTFIA